jgi:hypothetical protein
MLYSSSLYGFRSRLLPANDNELKATLKPFPSERMSTWPVGKAIGNVKNDTADLIERAAEQASLL